MPPMQARVTPVVDSVIEMWLRRIAVVMKKTAKTVMALTTKSSSAKMSALAVSIGIRRGPASGAEQHGGGVGNQRDVVGVVTRVVPGVGDNGRDQGAEADRDDHEHQQRPHGRPDRADLRPFGGEQPGGHDVPAGGAPAGPDS